jgi:probable F420-dependent oxidoreductase
MRAMKTKYRVGVMPGPWTSGEDGVELFWKFVDLCETTDIDSVWFSERLSSPQPVLEPMTTMAAVAARTRRLKFGPSVLIAPFRSPVLMARELAMIDYLSHGRMLPAVGVGAEGDREFRASGIAVKERGRRTDETIRILRRCWAEDEVTFEGEFWQLEKITVLPRPRQQPFPLWIGGNTEVAMRRTGQLGDGWIPSFITPESFAAGVDKTQAFATAAGR